MKVRQALAIESTDMADANHMANALNLVGGKHSIVDIDLRPFRVIAANDFTIEDVRSAVAIIQDRRTILHVEADEIVEEAAAGNDFDRRRAKTLADGMKANADHAVRLSQTFLENVWADLG